MNADYLSTRRTRKKELGRLRNIYGCEALSVNGQELSTIESHGDSRIAQRKAGNRLHTTFWSMLPTSVTIRKKLDFKRSTYSLNWILLWTMAFLGFVIFASQKFPTISVLAGSAFIILLIAIGILSRSLRDIIEVHGRMPEDDRPDGSGEHEDHPVANDFMAERYGLPRIETSDYVDVELSVPRGKAGDLIEEIYKAADSNLNRNSRQINAAEMSHWSSIYRPDAIASVRVRASNWRYMLELLSLPLMFAVTLAFIYWGVPWIVDRWDMANSGAAFIRGMVWPAQLMIVGLLILLPWMGVSRVWRWLIATSYRDEDNRARWRHRTDWDVQVLPAGTTKWVHVHSSTNRDSAYELHRLIAADIRASGKRFD